MRLLRLHTTFRKYTQGGSFPMNFLRRIAFHPDLSGPVNEAETPDLRVFCCYGQAFNLNILKIDLKRFTIQCFISVF